MRMKKVEENMSFDISRTSTLEAVSTADEQLLAQDLQKRLEESVRLAESQPDVMDAVAAGQQSADRLGQLRRAERTLSHFAAESRDQASAAAQAALDAIIESAFSGEKLDFRKVPALATIERQNHLATRAIQKLVEHSIPLAQIASLREESHALMARARAVEKIAQDRAEKVLGHLRDAVTEEMVLPVDMSKGVVGALLNHAAGLNRLALQISENADHLEKSYCERRTQ
jgi:hypothetical protein